MVVGSLVHRLLQGALRKRMWRASDIEKLLMEMFEEKDVVYMSYSSGIPIEVLKQEALPFITKIEKFIKDYVSKESSGLGKDNWKGRIVSIEDIEENVWCTTYGVKGKIDVTVRTEEGMVVPLELKTGKASMSLEHRGQLMLYTMMMNDLGLEVDSGLLLYLREDVLREIKARHNEKRDLIMLRNEQAFYLTRKPTVSTYLIFFNDLF